MTNTIGRSNRKLSFIVSKEQLICLIVLVILNIPGFLIDITTIYHTEHRFVRGDFAYLNFDFNLFELILIIWGALLLSKRSHNVNMLPIIIAVAAKEVFFLLIGKDNVFSYNSYEMFLCVLLAIACNDIVCKSTNDDVEYINKFLDLIIIFNFAWQIIFIVSGKISIGSRVNAISMGYGSVGYLCAMHILYTLLARDKTKKEWTIIAIGFVSIILSGSRYNLLISLLGILFFSGYILKNATRATRRWIVLALVVLVLIMIVSLINPSLFGNNKVLNRVLNLFQGGNFFENLSNDESFLGRILSMQIGIDLIKENPIGLSNSFIDIQGKTIEHGFFSFPHSNLMTYYLLWGIVFIFCIIWMIKTCNKASKLNNKGIQYFMIVFMVSNIVYGGVETAPKVYTYLFLLMSVIKLTLRRDLLREQSGSEA